MSAGRAFPVEDFVQAFTAQLDRAQDLLALKARTGRPLTFALKDLSVDLHVFWEADPSGRMLMRHAEANEAGASTLRFNFTSITRAGPHVWATGTLSVVTSLVPRGPYFFSYSASQSRTSGAYLALSNPLRGRA